MPHTMSDAKLLIVLCAGVAFASAACGRLPEQQQEYTIEELGLDLESMLAPSCPADPAHPGSHRIPLYHDCQEVPNSTGNDYVTLLAVMIDPALKGMTDQTFTALPRDRLVRVGVLRNKGAVPYEFAPKVIFGNSTFYCLYLGLGAPGDLSRPWRARLQECVDPHDPNEAEITWRNAWNGELHVRVERPSGNPAAYPDAASLDWDDANGAKKQIIGIRCGAAWCLVSGRGQPRLRPLPNPQINANRNVRGWHDQQVLAVKDASGKLKPQAMVATIMAEPGIEGIPDTDFTTPQLLARVHLSGHIPTYDSKFGFDTGSTNDGENLIKIWTTNGDWFAEIIPASGDSSRKFEVKRHPGDPNSADPPGSARWGWLSADERAWVRCGGACCEILETEVH